MSRRAGRGNLSELKTPEGSRLYQTKQYFTAANIAGSKSQRLLLPGNILADKERLYEQNHTLKQRLNELQSEMCRLKVQMTSREEDIVKKIRLIGRCNDSMEIESIFEQNVQALRRKNGQLQKELSSCRMELGKLQQSSRVIQLMQLQSENSELQEQNTKLRLKYELLRKEIGKECDPEQDKRFQQQALNYLAANRIGKLTTKNVELSRQNNTLRSDIASMRARMREFEKENDELLVERLELQQRTKKTKGTNHGHCQPFKRVDTKTSQYAEENSKYRRLLEDYKGLRIKYEKLKRKGAPGTSQALQQAMGDASLENYKKQELVVRLEHLEPIKDQLLQVGNLAMLELQPLPGVADPRVRISQAVSLLSGSPFFICGFQDRVRLARYLIETPDCKSECINPQESVPFRTFVSGLQVLINTIRVQSKERQQRSFREIVMFLQLNSAALLNHCPNIKPYDHQYRLSQLLQNLSDLDIHNKFERAIERVRTNNDQARALTWEEFVGCFKTLTEEKVT